MCMCLHSYFTCTAVLLAVHMYICSNLALISAVHLLYIHANRSVASVWVFNGNANTTSCSSSTKNIANASFSQSVHTHFVLARRKWACVCAYGFVDWRSCFLTRSRFSNIAKRIPLSLRCNAIKLLLQKKMSFWFHFWSRFFCDFDNLCIFCW